MDSNLSIGVCQSLPTMESLPATERDALPEARERRPRSPLRELVQQDGLAPLVAKEVRGQRLALPWHYHPELELMVVLEGRGRRRLGASESAFEEGDACLLGEHLPHRWISEGPTRCILLQFTRDVFGRGFYDLAEAAPVRALLDAARTGLIVPESFREDVHRQALRMIGSQSGLRQISCLLELLEGLANAAPKPVARPPVGAKPAWAAAERARRLDAYLLQALHGPVAQSEVARAVGLSSGGFSRFFAAHFGKPFVKYLAELRVRRARELLAMEDLPVSEVASASGYSNLSSFNRQFARLEGMTPSEYRRLAPVHRFTSMSGRVANTAIA